MLTISGVSKNFGGRALLSVVDLQVNREERIGLVGPNGAGKTTLFSLILGTASADEGTVTLERGMTLGYLPQESAPAGDETVLDLAIGNFSAIAQPETANEKAGVQHALSSIPADGQAVAKAKRILSGLGFRERDFERPARELSGGWVMRAHLARLLVQEPDLLMLDEPTNHLDLEALLWFQEYLKNYPGAILLISHDREFLNQLVGGIVEIRQSRLFRYRGNYEDYLVQRQAAYDQQLAAYKNQQREIAHLMEFVDRFRAKNTKAAQAQSKLKQIERMEKIQAPEEENRQISFSFPQPQRSGLKVITMKGVHHAYGENVVYRGIDFAAEREQRMVLVGPNGAGKSTLLKLLAGVLPVQAGERVLGHNVKEGYYSQNRVEMLRPERTVFEEACDTPQRVTEQFIRTILGCFLFRGDDVFKPVRVLSGGEKSRLALVKLLLDPPNLLLMDEPTTHLDMASIEALISALKQFQGTIIFISHDVYFIRAIANQVVHVNAGQLTHYSGDYQYYLDKTSATSARAALTAAGTNAVSRGANQKEEFQVATNGDSMISRKEQKRIEAEQRQARSRERREQQQLVHRLEKEIAALEKQQEELALELEKPETYAKAGAAMHINRELSAVVEQLEKVSAEWEAAATKLTALEGEPGGT